jgi:hypothetical protein
MCSWASRWRRAGYGHQCLCCGGTQHIDGNGVNLGRALMSNDVNVLLTIADSHRTKRRRRLSSFPRPRRTGPDCCQESIPRYGYPRPWGRCQPCHCTGFPCCPHLSTRCNIADSIHGSCLTCKCTVECKAPAMGSRRRNWRINRIQKIERATGFGPGTFRGQPLGVSPCLPITSA